MKLVHKAGATGAGAILLACSFIQPWEGLWTTAQVDTIGTGRPVTYCYGQTNEAGDVKVGQKFTPQQCSDLLAKTLPKYNAEISKCIHVPISDKERAAFISFAYNVGSAGFCRSSAAKKLNAGDHAGACDGLMSWTQAQGRVVKGLVNRRSAERKLCLEGVNTKPPAAPEPISFWQKLKLFFLSLIKAN